MEVEEEHFENGKVPGWARIHGVISERDRRPRRGRLHSQSAARPNIRGSQKALQDRVLVTCISGDIGSPVADAALTAHLVLDIVYVRPASH
jgi:hypothetical protein